MVISTHYKKYNSNKLKQFNVNHRSRRAFFLLIATRSITAHERRTHTEQQQ